jgi:hypothetical protein
MDVEWCARTLARNAECIEGMAEGMPDIQARWKPKEGSWSVLEVINHLYDEEMEDFRLRIDYTLYRPAERWPPIDPEGWVTERHYNQRVLESSLWNFLSARERSLAWLEKLPPSDWDRAYRAEFGSVRAGDILAAWVAHDVLHIRQLVELQFLYNQAQLEPYEVRYAGEW